MKKNNRKQGKSFKPDGDVAEKLKEVLGSNPKHGNPTKALNICLRFALIEHYDEVEPLLVGAGVAKKKSAR
jgi:hypothetical protein